MVEIWLNDGMEVAWEDYQLVCARPPTVRLGSSWASDDIANLADLDDEADA